MSAKKAFDKKDGAVNNSERFKAWSNTKKTFFVKNI